MKFRMRFLFSIFWRLKRRTAVALYFLSFILYLSSNLYSLKIARHSHATILLPDGNILVTGGVTGPGNNPIATVEIYITSMSAWELRASMNIARSSHTATLLSDGRVMVAGGYNNGTPLNTAEIYNPITNSWTPVPVNMTVKRGGHTATLLNKGPNAGKVLICGGQTNNTTDITNSCEVCDGSSCSAVVLMTSSRTMHTASLLSSGRVFVSGGRTWDGTNFVYLPTNEIYDPETNTWYPADPLLEARSNHSATVLNNGNVLIVGGYNALNSQENYGILESAEMFNPNGGRVQISAKDYLVMPLRVQDHSATLMPDGSLNILGGFGNITTTYYQANLKTEDKSKIALTHIDITTATLNSVGSTIQIKIDTTLSRAVAGRIVNGDVFFSKPKDPNEPTITVENVNIYLEPSTAPLDGTKIPFDKPGTLNTVLNLTMPNGKIVFTPETLSSADSTLNSPSNVTFSPSPLNSGKTAILSGGSLIIPLSIEVSKIFIGGVMSGTATLKSASITTDKASISITGGTGQVLNTPVGTSVDGKGLINPTITFTGIAGTITNSTDTPISSPYDVSDFAISNLSLYLQYTASLVNIADSNFNFDVATISVKHMIFSNILKYSPSESVWSFERYFKIPTFNHNSILTPAADLLTTGGKNCEDNPSNCNRNNLNESSAYNSNSTDLIIIPKNESKWTTGPSMMAKRGNHTSTLLTDGTILTCGGTDGNQALSICELYDPRTQKWEPAAPMNYPRSNHKAILLPNGNVLAIGGTINSSTQSTNTCELYYPDSKRWVLTNSMKKPRSYHSAMLLPDGNVIVMGGSTGNSYLNTAEVYITTAAEWQPISNTMNYGRMKHTATFLKNGKILIAGGINGDGALKSVEIYNPVTRSFTPGPSLNTERYFHTATLLKDGRVLVVGGSNGKGALDTAEIYDGSKWKLTSNAMTAKRANHTTTLLPNGKILVTGGENAGQVLDTVEGYDVDFSTWQTQGTMEKRFNHTTVLMPDNYLINIGGWDGTNYLNSTEMNYFSYEDDSLGFKTKIFEPGRGEVEITLRRQPQISSATAYFDRGQRVTLLSNTSNFYGLSEASGGGCGPMNSSFYNPRIYIQAVDNPSGFLVDLTTRVYSIYGGINNDWSKIVSSITLTMPSYASELPHGYYYFRAANNGQFSKGYIVQVTTPRPRGTVAQLTGAVASTTTIIWTWYGTIPPGTISGADGYIVLSSSNNVFLTTTSLREIGTFFQSNLAPNTPSSIKVAGYNIGGLGELVTSATYYTLANPPTDLKITSASFETASLEWSPNGNSDLTTYELSISEDHDFRFDISTPIPFTESYKSTSATISNLTPGVLYYFRVRAMNAAGITTDFNTNSPPYVSTITVGQIRELSGNPLNVSSIRWEWSSAIGANGYDIYQTTPTQIFLGSTTYNHFTQTNLSTNTFYGVKVIAKRSNPPYSDIFGPPGYKDKIYTLASQPKPGAPTVFTSVSTGSFIVNWIPNGNPYYTKYQLDISTDNFSTLTVSVYANGTNFQFNGLMPNTKYYVRIRAFNENGIPTNYTNLGSKYTLAQAPPKVQAVSVEMSGITLQWDVGANPPYTIYEVRGTTDSTFTWYQTFVPFANEYKLNRIFINGLLTSTAYYFDVAAKNCEGVETAKTQLVPPEVITKAGPNGAPSGSVGGTSDPSKTVVIEGILPNGRRVSLEVPAASFPKKATAIAISSSNMNLCNYTVNGKPIEVAIYTDSDSQPYTPFTLKIYYTKPEAATIDPNSQKLVIARYDSVSGQCLPMETTIDYGPRIITATLNHLNHLSIFQLIYKDSVSNFDNMEIYPNPVFINRPGYIPLTINNIPSDSNVKIYTLSGEKVWETTANKNMITWRGINRYGEKVASGIYLCIIESSVGKKIVKIAIER